MYLFSDEIESELQKIGYDVIDRGNDRVKDGVYVGCNWWHLNYKFLKLSVYYDPSDALGVVGVPYYELYDGMEDYRYIADQDDLEFLSDAKTHIINHKKSVEEEPELWL